MKKIIITSLIIVCLAFAESKTKQLGMGLTINSFTSSGIHLRYYPSDLGIELLGFINSVGARLSYKISGDKDSINTRIAIEAGKGRPIILEFFDALLSAISKKKLKREYIALLLELNGPFFIKDLNWTADIGCDWLTFQGETKGIFCFGFGLNYWL